MVGLQDLTVRDVLSCAPAGQSARFGGSQSPYRLVHDRQADRDPATACWPKGGWPDGYRDAEDITERIREWERRLPIPLVLRWT